MPEISGMLNDSLNLGAMAFSPRCVGVDAVNGLSNQGAHIYSHAGSSFLIALIKNSLI